MQNIQRDYHAPGIAILLLVILIPLTSLILHYIDHIPYFKSSTSDKNAYEKKLMIVDCYKILIEFICLLLTIPSIIDLFRNFQSLNVSEWNLASYNYLLWALWLIAAIYVYELITLGIRTNNLKDFKHDIAHWVHHIMHIFIINYTYFFKNNVTYFALRLAVVYAFWTFIAAIPICYSVIRHLMKISTKERYYIYLINSYLFAIGNAIRCISGIIIYVYYFKYLGQFIQIMFIPGVICWSIDQMFTSMILKNMALKEYEKMINVEVNKVDINITEINVNNINATTTTSSNSDSLVQP